MTTKTEEMEQFKAAMKKRCDALLFAMIGREDLCENWWNGPNIAFDLHHPADVFEKNPLRVYNYIAGHAAAGGGS